MQVNCPIQKRLTRNEIRGYIQSLENRSLFRNLLILSIHIAHLCSRVGHRSCSCNPPQSSFIFLSHRSNSTSLVESNWLSNARSRSNRSRITQSNANTQPTTHTRTHVRISCFTICRICYKHISPCLRIERM